MGGKIKIFTTEVTEGTQRVSQGRMGLDEQLGCEIRKRLW